jgi:hypothetical protein
MNILIISHAYTPLISPRAFRWSTIAEIWARQGHHVDVVCNWYYGLPRDESIQGVQIHRVGGRFSERLRRQLDSSPKAITSVTGNKIGISDGKATSFAASMMILGLKWLHDMTWKKIYWPDFACAWYLPAFRLAARLTTHNRYDALVSVSIPFTSHLIGLRLKKKLPTIPWVVDVGDPFCFMDATPLNNHMLYHQFNVSAEKLIFKSANSISVTTPKTANIYKKIFPESSHKISVIPPLLDDRIKYTGNNNKKETIFNSNKITLSYIGNFYKVTREPEALLLLLRSLLHQFPEFKKQLLLHIFGNLGGFKETFEAFSDLSSHIILHGAVSRDTVFRVIRETDFLINIGNRTNYQIPSKIVEYIASGNPIINICTIDGDSSREFLKDYPLIHNIFIHRKCTGDMIYELSHFIKANSKTKLDANSLNIFLQPYRSHNIAEKYGSLLGIH